MLAMPIVHTDGRLRPGHMETVWVKKFPGQGKISIGFAPTAICEGGCSIPQQSPGHTDAHGRGRFRVRVPNGFYTLGNKFVPFRDKERIKVSVRWERPGKEEFDAGTAEPEPVIVRDNGHRTASGGDSLSASGATATASAAKKKSKAKKKSATGGAFCGAPVVDNYRAPLEKLKPIPAVPEGGVLPFAPAGLTLGVTGPQEILLGPTSVGLRLANAAATTPRLDWVVLERLIRFSADGSKIQPAGLKRIDLKQLPAGKYRGLTFPLTGAPGIYSLEITIQNHRGRLLGRYGEYLRMVARTVDVGIKLAAYDNVVPGSYLESCFENHGSAAITPTVTSLERFDGAIWRPVPVGPVYTPEQTPIQRTLGPGEAEKIGTLIPPNAKPGLYKLNALGTVLDSGEPVAISAEFGVL